MQDQEMQDLEMMEQIPRLENAQMHAHDLVLP